MDVPTLPDQPAEHPVLDYAALVREGIDLLERLSGDRWTDFNSHDPGITLLEAACYGLTDLGFRIFHELPDLLADGGRPPPTLFSPAEVLTGHAVTLTDLRKLVLDVPGVRNVWIEPATGTGLTAQPGDRIWTLTAGIATTPATPLSGRPVTLSGLYRVLIEKSGFEDVDDLTLRRRVAERLHANRALCEDFDEIRVVPPQPVTVEAAIEIDVAANGEDMLFDVYDRIDAWFSPAPSFSTLTEGLARGVDTDALFEGPALNHGFLDTAAVEAVGRRQELHCSDLIRALMAVPGVRAVRRISLALRGVQNHQLWSLPVDTTRGTPQFAFDDSRIRLYKDALEIAVDAADVARRHAERRRRIRRFPPLPRDRRDLIPPRGTDRSVASYYSLCDDLPAAYGVGRAGLPGSAPDARQAQAHQLRAYLALFEQILANEMAQLAHVRDLLSFEDDGSQSYFSQPLDSGDGAGAPPLVSDDLDPRTLQALVEPEEAVAGLRRRNRFLDHLLARFGEELSDVPQDGTATGRDDPSPRPAGVKTRLLSIAAKRAFLRGFPWLSGARGCGHNLDSAALDQEVPLAVRIRLKLGCTDAERDRIFVIEHILLRPLEKDRGQSEPFLADAAGPDPFSLQLTLILPDHLKPFATAVHQTVGQEAPAHLIPRLYWLDPAGMQVFRALHGHWTAALRDFRQAGGPGGVTGPEASDAVALRFRDARDRLIEWLRLGQTSPLQDLPVQAAAAMVPHGSSTTISIESSQRGVVYALRLQGRPNTPPGPRHTDTGTGGTLVLETDPITVDTTFRHTDTGTGGTLVLETDPITVDTTFVVQANKPDRPGVRLFQTAAIKVGLDKSLKAEIKGWPGPGTPILDFDATVEVVLDRSQRGVEYRLVHFPAGAPADPTSLQQAEQDQILSANRKAVPGTGNSIVLPGVPLRDDTVLRIRATKTFQQQPARAPETAVLNVALPVFVRANPALEVTPWLVVAWRAATGITVTAAQAGLSYRALTRPIADGDFDRGGPVAGKILSIPVTGAPAVRVKLPPPPSAATRLEGFEQRGECRTGTGADLTLPLPALPEQDVFVAIEVTKSHTGADGVISPSTIWLNTVAAVLVGPNPDQCLTVAVALEDGKTIGDMTLTGGQPGVFYTPRVAPDGPPFPLPAYFHQRDRQNAAWNKGIGQLNVEVDLVVAADPVPPPMAELPAERPPAAPRLPCAGLPAGTRLHFRAVKAQTGVAVDPIAFEYRIPGASR
jgi:hypothetical protein